MIDDNEDIKKSKIFLQIRDIINRHDPIDFLDMGCPNDEYDDEVLLIIPLLEKCKTVKNLGQEILSIFVECCDAHGPNLIERFEAIASDIFKMFNDDKKS
jgi:hypothetical protein